MSSVPQKAFSLQSIVRPNIWALKPYRCARDDYSTGILLDANENTHGPALPPPEALSTSHLNRYPDPHQSLLKSLVAAHRGLDAASTGFFVGVGSDECLDLVVRVFCVPGKEKVLVCPPTYGMYGVVAQVNDVGVTAVPLDVEGGRFQLRVDEIAAAVEANPAIKVIFLCHPGNPTGTLLAHDDIRAVLELQAFHGIVVVDEAYIDFCDQGASVVSWVARYPNLIVTQTLSKAFGLAGIRLGAAITTPEIAQILNSAKAPYNVSTPASALALSALSAAGLTTMRTHVSSILAQRDALISKLGTVPRLGPTIGGNDANFVLVPVLDAQGRPSNPIAKSVYRAMAEQEGVVVRFRGEELGCEGCLRVTVGTEEENGVLIEKLRGLLADLA
ncbi:histidinol-phosphate transaminase [Geranomyces variabilis]|uniref:histidinol-phosphate transaminase n=1 Tax=Geranomyces variabilis TaxID=109894 RepID=A0AAD5XMM0_9FUNG|nr:histidinol-phosphate transaminase [Geranomyces variabilis]